MKTHLATVVACLFCSSGIQLCNGTLLRCEQGNRGYEFLARVIRHFSKPGVKKENLTLRNLSYILIDVAVKRRVDIAWGSFSGGGISHRRSLTWIHRY